MLFGIPSNSIIDPFVIDYKISVLDPNAKYLGIICDDFIYIVFKISMGFSKKLTKLIFRCLLKQCKTLLKEE